MGESFSQDPAEQTHIAAHRQLWTVVFLGAWLTALVASAAIAGFTLRTNRIVSFLTLAVLTAFVVFAVVWGS